MRVLDHIVTGGVEPWVTVANKRALDAVRVGFNYCGLNHRRVKGIGYT